MSIWQLTIFVEQQPDTEAARVDAQSPREVA
jgi:hypothetical protein